MLGRKRYSPPRIVTKRGWGLRKNGGSALDSHLPRRAVRLADRGSPCRGRGRTGRRRRSTAPGSVSNWRQMLALKQTKTRPRSMPSSSSHAGGQRRAVGAAAADDAVAVGEPAAEEAVARRAGWRGGCARRAGSAGRRGSLGVTEVVDARRVGGERRVRPRRARAPAACRRASGRRSSRPAAPVRPGSARPLGQEAPERRDVHVQLAVDHERAVAVERRRGGVGQGPSSSTWPCRNSPVRTSRQPPAPSGWPSPGRAATPLPAMRRLRDAVEEAEVVACRRAAPRRAAR